MNKYLLMLAFTFSTNSFAWDGQATGLIQEIDVASPGDNYGFRITLKGSPALCSSGYSWAYINDSDSNSKTFISVLLAAKLAEKNVTIYTNKETASGNNYCHIEYISLQ